MGEIVSDMPARCLWAEWDKDIYLDPPLAQFEANGRPLRDALTQFSLDVEESDASGVRLLLEGLGLVTRIQFKIAESPQFSYVSDADPRIELVFGRRTEDIIDYLNDSPLNLMLDDWSRICGEISTPPASQSMAVMRSATGVEWDFGGRCPICIIDHDVGDDL
jgi:hypothetical protein